MNEIIKKILDHFVLVLALNELQRQKNDAVKRQDFQQALILRDEEVEASKELISFGELKQLREQLKELQ